MAFGDMDALESMLGKRAETMTDSELVSYLKTFMHVVHDLKLPISAQRERAIMAGLQRTYGREEAGKLVKWALWKHQGMAQGRPITYSSFSKGMKWLTDRWYLELQQHLKKQERKVSASQPFSSLGDL